MEMQEFRPHHFREFVSRQLFRLTKATRLASIAALSAQTTSAESFRVFTVRQESGTRFHSARQRRIVCARIWCQPLA